MSNSNPSNYTSIQMLPEEQRFDGENFVSWKNTMLPTGRIKGLNLYWEGVVTVPSPPLPDTPHTPQPYSTPTAVNDPFPNLLEYRLRESVAYLTIWNNIKNPMGLGGGEKDNRAKRDCREA
ncbi:hypothetical protein L218DRAFT_509185 [Marasmius fiardii PR-910]|nr:hypothetical protein L218DRAFT_509185 [Marasmius fiardii PR-910]